MNSPDPASLRLQSSLTTPTASGRWRQSSRTAWTRRDTRAGASGVNRKYMADA